MSNQPFSSSSRFTFVADLNMYKLLPFVLAPTLMMVVSLSGQALGAIISDGPGPTRFSVSLNVRGPEPFDFKKQELPKKIPAPSQAKTIPNLDPLFEQLFRHYDLDSSARKIMPWVYTTTTETVVADYEDAMTRLDLADICLQEAMRNMLCEHDSIGVDPLLIQATSELDYAEFTIMLLVEIAKLEL
jgi:hypothetical protein